jgi:hypothetical protein
VAQIAHRGGNLQAAILLFGLRRDKFEWGWLGLRQLHLKTLVATPA